MKLKIRGMKVFVRRVAVRIERMAASMGERNAVAEWPQCKWRAFA